MSLYFRAKTSCDTVKRKHSFWCLQTRKSQNLRVLLTFCIDIQINRQFVDPACLSRLLIGSSSKNGDLSTHNTRVPSLAPSHLHIFCYNWVPRTIVTKCLPTVMPSWAVFVAQLVERSLPIPDVRSQNPVIGKKLFILNICLL